MKKAYITPNARIISLSEEHDIMNTGSLQSMDIYDDEKVTDPDEVMSNRRNSIWGD